MKTKKFNKTLNLKKTTIAHLNGLELDNAKGGVPNTYSCPSECDNSCLMTEFLFGPCVMICETVMKPSEFL